MFGTAPFGLTPDAVAVLAGTVWVVVWWVTEAIPIPATCLLPIAIFPFMGVMNVTGAAAPYADPIVFLLLGEFLIALAVERWNLPHRLSLVISNQKNSPLETVSRTSVYLPGSCGPS